MLAATRQSVGTSTALFSVRKTHVLGTLTVALTLMGVRMGEGCDNTEMHYASTAYGGQGGIRTHGTLAGTPHFECGAIDHSTTCPRAGI
jgi:hypothetical protein